jgi:serine O-acetyltransferase
MHACVNIGASGGSSKAPQLGNSIYIGPGAKIYGDITIPNNTAIGANAVVNKSFDKENTALAGVPAKVIGDINIKEIIKHL